jgi:putative endonuclease
MSGLVSYHAGLAAEANVARRLEQGGHQIVKMRHKTRYGEVDIISQANNKIFFFEVKKAKNHEIAASRVTPRCQKRIYDAASCYLASNDVNPMAEVRVMAALQDGEGRVKFENIDYH